MPGVKQVGKGHSRKSALKVSGTKPRGRTKQDPSRSPGKKRSMRAKIESPRKSRTSTHKRHSTRKTFAGFKFKKFKPLVAKRSKYRIIVRGKNRTPRLIRNVPLPPYVTKRCRDILKGVLYPKIPSPEVLPSQNTELSVHSKRGEPQGPIAPSVFENIEFNIEELRMRRRDQFNEPEEEEAPPRFLLPKLASIVSPPLPTEIFITNVETPTFFLLEQPSLTEVKGTDEGKKVEEENLKYQQLLKLMPSSLFNYRSQDSQVFGLRTKQQSCMAECLPRKNKSTNVTAWDFFCTLKVLNSRRRRQFINIGNIIIPTMYKTAEALEELGEIAYRRRKNVNEKIQPPKSDGPTKEELFLALEKTPAFQHAAFTVERILASNVYMEEQNMFKHTIEVDPFNLDIEYKYRLEFLWTFCCESIMGRAVTAMSQNPINSDIVAVGYGKYYFNEHSPGFVCCWCIKNPTQPERIYYFRQPVTTLKFSKEHPNQLGVGFYNGHVIIIDVSARNLSIIATNSGSPTLAHSPVWHISWFHTVDYHKDEEQIIASNQDGNICRFKRGREFGCFPMMRISKMEGHIKGIEPPGKCQIQEIPISCHPGALIIALHPVDPLIYYVGSDEGCIHKCNINYLNQHLDIFLAHNGPVYSMEFSPFCASIFLTCGADWAIRIWSEGIGEPITSLVTTMVPVQGAMWSPINSTIIVSCSGTSVHMWDLHRKSFEAASATKSENNTQYTVVRFTASGQNVLAGDLEGRVSVFSLRDMPFSPYYQKQSLANAISKILVAREDVMEELQKTDLFK